MILEPNSSRFGNMNDMQPRGLWVLELMPKRRLLI